jgi:hypothetical protein
LVATHNAAISTPMLPMVSDYDLNGSGLAVDWITLTPYFSTCTYESAVIDATSLADWLNLTWTGSTPTGTAVSVATRSGDTLRQTVAGQTGMLSTILRSSIPATVTCNIGLP